MTPIVEQFRLFLEWFDAHSVKPAAADHALLVTEEQAAELERALRVELARGVAATIPHAAPLSDRLDYRLEFMGVPVLVRRDLPYGRAALVAREHLPDQEA